MSDSICINGVHKENEKTYNWEFSFKKPSEPNVEHYVGEFDSFPEHEYEYSKVFSGDSDNRLRENTLLNFFKKHPHNTVEYLSDVLLKVTLLNSYYRTFVRNDCLVPIARYIASINGFDEIIRCGRQDEQRELVNHFAYGYNMYKPKEFNEETDFELKIVVANLYSFASKYCSFSSRALDDENDSFPIVDSIAKGMLVQINKIWEFDKSITYKKGSKVNNFTQTCRKLNDYTKYCETYDKFKAFFGLNNLPNKDIDKYLWTYGREKVHDKNGKEIIIEKKKSKRYLKVSDVVKIDSSVYDEELSIEII